MNISKDVWQKIKHGSRITWKTAIGDTKEAIIFDFSNPTNLIGIRTDIYDKEAEIYIYIEQITGLLD